MRTGRVGTRVVFACAVLAFAACSKGTLMPDVGILTGSGGSAAAGMSGQAAAGGGAGMITVSGGGGVNISGCTAANVYATCSVGSDPPPLTSPVGGPCSVEGAHCNGYSCRDSFSGFAWEASCCAGYWYATAGGCPNPAQPGDSFNCGGSARCVAGQSFCSYSNEGRASDFSYACKPLCAAGDCTCFCDKPDACDFKPAGSTCPADTCQCFSGATAEGIPIPGTVSVFCSYLVPGNNTCYRDTSLDSQCGGLSRAYLCQGPVLDVGGSCTQIPDSLITASCGSEIHGYCCGG